MNELPLVKAGYQFKTTALHRSHADHFKKQLEAAGHEVKIVKDHIGHHVWYKPKAIQHEEDPKVQWSNKDFHISEDRAREIIKEKYGN
jgi:hypothetical protein